MNDWINHHQFTGTYVGWAGGCVDCDAEPLEIIDDLVTAGARLLDLLEKAPNPPSIKRPMKALQTALDAAVCKGKSASDVYREGVAGHSHANWMVEGGYIDDSVL